MPPKPDRLTDLYAEVAAQPSPGSPWLQGGVFDPDYDLLRRLLQVLVRTRKINNAQTGGPALAVDVWLATELRRAGFAPDAVWPRAVQPRVLPQSLTTSLDSLKLSRSVARADIERKIIDRLVAKAGASRSTVVGGQFVKEVDVVIAEHDRGLELAVSSKAMTKSYGKNVTNRWEEASGDLLNLRRRFPLVSFGFAFLVTSRIVTAEPVAFERLKDMLRKLTTVIAGTGGSAYDASCLLMADWSNGQVRLDHQRVPNDLAPPAFFETLIREVFSRSPVDDHGEARALWLASSPPTP